MSEQQVRISLEVLRALVGYLAQRPYAEVYEHIRELQEAASRSDEEQPQADEDG